MPLTLTSCFKSWDISDEDVLAEIVTYISESASSMPGPKYLSISTLFFIYSSQLEWISVGDKNTKQSALSGLY